MGRLIMRALILALMLVFLSFNVFASIELLFPFNSTLEDASSIQAGSVSPNQVFELIFSDNSGFNFECNTLTIDDSSLPGALAPANNQRYMDAVIVAVGLGTGHGHAVVTGDENQRIFQLTRRVKAGNNLAQVRVEVIYFVGIIEQHRSAVYCVRQEARDLYPGQILVTVRDFGVRQMRFVRTIPEIERLIGAAFIQELLEVPGIVNI